LCKKYCSASVKQFFSFVRNIYFNAEIFFLQIINN
jgi:hypothetical protein